MKLKIFTLTFSDSKNGFDDHAIQDFQSDREIIEVTEHFFVHEQTPYLTVLLSYRDIAADEKRKPAPKRPSLLKTPFTLKLLAFSFPSDSPTALLPGQKLA